MGFSRSIHRIVGAEIVGITPQFTCLTHGSLDALNNHCQQWVSKLDVTPQGIGGIITKIGPVAGFDASRGTKGGLYEPTDRT
jgi:hypothetical protein